MRQIAYMSPVRIAVVLHALDGDTISSIDAVMCGNISIWVGRRTYRSAFAAVRHGNANMDTLIALGTGASLLTGPAGFFFPVKH